MPEYADVYALAPTHDRATLDRFLARFAPHRAESADEYELPQFNENPIAVYLTADELLPHLFARAAEEYAVYWRKTDGPGPDHAMVFFTPDGGLILGVSCSPADADRWLEELFAFVGNRVGYINHEQPPAATASEFRAVATARANSSS